MKNRILIFTGMVFLVSSAFCGTGQPDYRRYFNSYRLRVDCIHYGNARTEGFALDSIREECRWGGNPDKLIDPFDYGTYKVELFDHATGKRVYSRGFSSLFGEYKTTKQARSGLVRAFPESFLTPMPLHPADLVVSVRVKGKKFRRLWKLHIDPASYKIIRQTPDEDVHIFKPWHTGEPAHSLDIMVVGDGYCKRQARKFQADLRHFTNVFLHASPFSEHKNRINIYGVLVYSRDCGISEPRKGRYLRTAVGVSFDSLGSARYMTTRANRALRDAGARVPYDIIYIMGNTARYGGGGIYNLYSVFAADNEWDDYLITHEFGHAFAGLADEYYSSQVAYDEFYPKGIEPWEPNITRAHTRARLKWRKLVNPSTPIPTPDTPDFAHVTGAFEGGGYVAKGIFRPAHTCKMKDKGFLPFCAVCKAAIERMIDYYTSM